MMRFSIFLTAFLLITMSSCSSRKAFDFKESLAKAERKAFQIIVGKDGPEEKKLKYLINNDYKNALIVVDQQSKEFDQLIDDIEKLSTEGISEGEPLKTASIAYYKALKDLHGFDRKEIEQQEILKTEKNNQLKTTAQNTIIAFAKEKKKFYAAVYEKEALLQTATEKFNTSNGF